MGDERAISVCHLMSGDLWGGAEAQLAVLLAELKNEPALKLESILLNRGQLAEKIGRCEIPLRIIPEDGHSFFEIRSLLVGHFRDSRPDILHSHRYKENLLAASVRRTCGIPGLVQTVHGLPEADPGIRGLKARVISHLDRRFVGRLFHRIIPVSQDICTRMGHQPHDPRISVIRNGVDLTPAPAEKKKSDVRRELGFGSDVLIVGTVGRMVPVKGFHRFLESLPQVFSAHSSARAVMVGDGPLLPSLRMLAEELGLADRIHFTGFRENARELTSIMDVFVLSSRHEGIPMALLEAMALGVPVVATRVGGIPEVVQHEGLGFLVPPDDSGALSRAVTTLLDNASLRAGMGRAGAEWIEQEYSARVMAEKTLAVYREVAEETRPRGGTTIAP